MGGGGWWGEIEAEIGIKTGELSQSGQKEI